MKIGVISDTHFQKKSDQLPQEIIAEFSHVDMILHAGDLANLGVLEKLKSLCRDVKAVWGNMDPYEVRKALPEKELITVGKFRIGLMHGAGAPSGLVELLGNAFKNERVDLIVFGHSHQPMNEMVGGTLFFNPGSPSDKIFAPYNSYGIIEIGDKIEARIVKL